MKLSAFSLTVFSLMVGLLGGGAARGEEARRAERAPNLLFLLADDMRADSMRCAGNPLIQTPNLDRLAGRGTRFANAFVATSICCVSRASIFSGQCMRRHHIEDFATAFTTEAWSRTYPQLLRGAGYRAGFIGKFGVGTRAPAETFDYWDGFDGQGSYFEPGKEGHLTRRMGESAFKFIDGCEAGKPFCLSISFKAPHAGDGEAREFPPDPADEALYAEARLPESPNLAEEAFLRLPESVRRSEGRTRWERRFNTKEKREATVRDNYRLVTGMDREIGRILARLEEKGLLASTVVVFMSDNGFFLGERGLSDKFFMYEESIRVPLIVADFRANAAGRTETAMALNIDVAPTLLDYAGVEIPAAMQGKSLRPFAEGRAAARRTDWLYEHHFDFGGKIPRSEGVRGERWKYIRYIDEKPPIEELYDLESDPLEAKNLAGEKGMAETLEMMRKRWEELRKEME